MTADPRAALDRFIAALEAHYNAVAARRGEDDPAVDDAYYVLADAFEVYDEALGQVHGEATPFYLAEEDDEDEDEDDDEEDEDALDDLDDTLDDDVLTGELETDGAR
ncbi:MULTISPECIES: primosomal protein [Cellulosimicrobium]|uniref:Primosomal protein n=1 Tax=Cellulosimicrobium sp. ES-005 TaxID=3163031 RepID=A0AAU8G6G7_9MICO|nr:primosomal protein [Cellulosimicrobium cellulans]MCO7272010.1 primosomal protein [Cellulosimicrobium cellulans]